MSKRKKKKKRNKQKREERRKQFQAFRIEFKDIVDAIVDKLLTYTDDLPEGFIIEYEINDMKALAQMLRQKLSLKLQKVEGKPRIPKGNILLWHGTSLIRADSILESGFKRKKRGVFFSSNIMTSLSFAERRGIDGRSEPAIFAAVYDLSTLRYGKEFQHHQHHYIFKPGVATRIVKYLLTYHGLYSIGKITTEANKFKDDLTDIAITQSSGNTGIAYWLNSFLDLDDSKCSLRSPTPSAYGIPENHPAVSQIKAWVDEQYAGGRMIPIADEEILILAKEYLPEYF
jgi:hypothetical protein